MITAINGRDCIILDAYELKHLLERLYNPANINYLADKGDTQTMDDTLALLNLCKQTTEDSE
jgi:hypothetical protein